MSKFPERIKQVRTIIQRNLFSICCCENELIETLWLKYANNYRGFVQVYDMKDENTFLCGKEDACKNCRSSKEKPSVYPVYYTEEPYDATRFALACLLWGEQVSPQIKSASSNTSKSLASSKYKSSSSAKKSSDLYDAKSNAHPDDFYYDNRDDFRDDEDAKEYYDCVVKQSLYLAIKIVDIPRLIVDLLHGPFV